MSINKQHPIFLADSIQILKDFYNKHDFSNEDDSDGLLETKNFRELEKTISLLQKENILSYDELESRLRSSK